MILVSHIDNGVNIEGILEEMGLDEQKQFLAYAADTAYNYMDKYVPRSNGGFQTLTGKYGTKVPLYVPGGMLREEHEIYPEGDGITIEYTQPYARYQYYGVREDGSHKINPENYTTPGTGPYWDLAMLTAEGEDYMEELCRFVEKRLK